jgi:hypothetical protein
MIFYQLPQFSFKAVLLGHINNFKVSFCFVAIIFYF